MSSRSIDKHYKKLKEVTKSWDEAIDSAKNKTTKEFNQKRIALNEKLNKMKAEKIELINNFQISDLQIKQDLIRIDNQIYSFETQMTGTEVSPTSDRKNPQLDQFLADYQNDLSTVFERYRDKVKRMEQILERTASQEKKLNTLMAGKTPMIGSTLKTALDEKNKNINELFQNLETMRTDIEKKFKELIEIERKESEEMESIEKKGANDESKDRNEEMTKFIDKIKKTFKK